MVTTFLLEEAESRVPRTGASDIVRANLVHHEQTAWAGKAVVRLARLHRKHRADSAASSILIILCPVVVEISTPHVLVLAWVSFFADHNV